MLLLAVFLGTSLSVFTLTVLRWQKTHVRIQRPSCLCLCVGGGGGGVGVCVCVCVCVYWCGCCGCVYVGVITVPMYLCGVTAWMCVWVFVCVFVCVGV